MTSRLIVGDCRSVLQTLETGSMDCCVTSPPYFGLRDYGVDEQIGLESSPQEFVQQLVAVFREVRRVLTEEGTLWLNLGDSYARTGGWSNNNGLDGVSRNESSRAKSNMTGNGSCSQKKPVGFKSKDLLGIPWRVAFALQNDGWYLRQDIIWHKSNPMPEAVADRCTKAHEYIFLLAKSERYHFDHTAILEEAANGTKRNKRSVWSVNTRPFRGAHFATFPPDLIMPCILAGCRPGGMVLDPFNGAGTTGLVALQNARHYVGIELNREYAELTKERLGLMSPEIETHHNATSVAAGIEP